MNRPGQRPIAVANPNADQVRSGALAAVQKAQARPIFNPDQVRPRFTGGEAKVDVAFNIALQVKAGLRTPEQAVEEVHRMCPGANERELLRIFTGVSSGEAKPSSDRVRRIDR